MRSCSIFPPVEAFEAPAESANRIGMGRLQRMIAKPRLPALCDTRFTARYPLLRVAGRLGSRASVTAFYGTHYLRWALTAWSSTLKISSLLFSSSSS